MSRDYRNPPEDLRSKIGGHGRKRRSEDVPRIDVPKRRRTEGGKGTGNTTRPIGFKELENICKEDLAQNSILGLANKAEKFEALLALEEVRPDLLKLVVSAFRILCSANNLMKENAEKLLRSPIVKRFMTGTVLSSFINKMPHSDCWKDESDRVSVVSDLTEIFLALIQRFGESIVHGLPLPQLSASLDELKKMNLIEDASNLDKKIRQVNQLKTEVIRRAKSSHEQESGTEPPQNFRELSVIPQAADLCFSPFLRENITDRKFQDLEHYLDVQFRLLREDFVMPLRNGIEQLTKKGKSLETSSGGKAKRTNDVSVYHDVTVLYPVCSRGGRIYRIRFNSSHPKVMRVNWERSKRLKFGSMVCLSSDEFRTLVFATVENRDAEGLTVGELEVRFENVGTEEINQFVEGEATFVMIESPAYFEAYRHTLEALKEIKPDELPFQKQIVECCQDVGPPEYQVRKGNNSAFAFNFTGVLAVEAPVNLASPVSSTEIILDSSSLESQPGSGNSKDPSTDVEVPMDEIPSAQVKQECIFDAHNWPDSESLGFNESQMRGFKMALTKKFAVIQGPPGTGKTYVGLKIARVLLQTASLWKDEKERSPILMVSYTNHALDQFLEGLLTTTTGELYLNVLLHMTHLKHL